MLTLNEVLRVAKRADGTEWEVSMRPENGGYVVVINEAEFTNVADALALISTVKPIERDNSNTLEARRIARRAIDEAVYALPKDTEEVVIRKLAKYALMFAPASEKPEPKKRTRKEPAA